MRLDSLSVPLFLPMIFTFHPVMDPRRMHRKSPWASKPAFLVGDTPYHHQNAIRSPKGRPPFDPSLAPFFASPNIPPVGWPTASPIAVQNWFRRWDLPSLCDAPAGFAAICLDKSIGNPLGLTVGSNGPQLLPTFCPPATSGLAVNLPCILSRSCHPRSFDLGLWGIKFL